MMIPYNMFQRKEKPRPVAIACVSAFELSLSVENGIIHDTFRIASDF